MSGKYTRQNAGTVKPDRGQWAESGLGERCYAVVDELTRIAKELDSTVARVALAWVQARPGAPSGCRRAARGT